MILRIYRINRIVCILLLREDCRNSLIIQCITMGREYCSDSLGNRNGLESFLLLLDRIESIVWRLWSIVRFTRYQRRLFWRFWKITLRIMKSIAVWGINWYFRNSIIYFNGNAVFVNSRIIWLLIVIGPIMWPIKRNWFLIIRNIRNRERNSKDLIDRNLIF